MSSLIVPGEKKEEPQAPVEPPHHPRDEDLVEGVACPFVSTIQVFQPHPKPTSQPRMIDGQIHNAQALAYFEPSAQAFWAQCHKRCALFDHDNDCCSQSARSRNVKPQEVSQ